MCQDDHRSPRRRPRPSETQHVVLDSCSTRIMMMPSTIQTRIRQSQHLSISWHLDLFTHFQSDVFQGTTVL